MEAAAREYPELTAEGIKHGTRRTVRRANCTPAADRYHRHDQFRQEFHAFDKATGRLSRKRAMIKSAMRRGNHQ